MEPIPSLAEHFKAGRTVLVLIGDQAFLSEPDSVFARTRNAGGVQFRVIDLKSLWERMPFIVGDRTAFNRSDLTNASSLRPQVIRGLEKAGLITPNDDGQFGIEELFACCMVGALRRSNADSVVVKKVTNFLVKNEPLESANDSKAVTCD